ncbi:MAG TPA: LysM peptidoglycan-binding domain-containing protein, partial [Parvularculaceae bacterium]|nr:LysM peptidoglycan-binding domain-containing protein [Parvularculaceae bacterium]
MTKLHWTMALLATSALAGCGSHNHAPVVYGTAPNAQQTARIYTSPDQIAAERRAAQSAQYAARPAYSTAPEYSDGIAPAVAARGPAPLTPVTETGREGRTSYGSEPIYLAAAQAPEPAVTETLPGQVTVLPGDTVYAISRRTGATPQSIIALNRLQPPYAIEIGQTIRVPSSAVPPSHYSTTAVAAPAAPVEMRDGQHVVRPGDTLYSISRSTGASVAEIAGANRLRAPYTLSVGETLRIP